MKKLARFIVRFRLIFAIVFVALSIVSIYLMTLVKQNYDMTKYLPDDTDTMRGLAVMQEEFGLNNNVMLMLQIGEDEVPSMQSKLSSIQGITLVTFNSYKDGSALFMLTLEGDEYSEGAKQTLKRIEDFLNSENFAINDSAYLGGSLVASNGLESSLKFEIPIILVIAIVIIFLVLLLTSHSWLEPVIFAIVLLCAVLINMGTNVIFGEISYITFAVSAILQMALAMDYSIILLHSFTEKQREGLSKEEAIVEALAYNMRPISSSGLTTIAGLIALLFMTFAIGFDIGIVLAKGILVSLLSVLLFMPSLLMIFSKALEKTRHKPIPLGGGKVAGFSIKLRNVLPIVMVLVIAGAYVLQMSNVYTFSGWDTSSGQNVITERFGETNQAVVIIDNEYADDKDAQTGFINAISPLNGKDSKPAFKTITSWATLEVSVDSLLDRINIDIPLKASDVVRIWEGCGGDIYEAELSLDMLASLMSASDMQIRPEAVYEMLKGEDGKVTVNSAITKILDLKNSILGGLLPDNLVNIAQILNDNRDEITLAAKILMDPVVENLKEEGENKLDIDLSGIATTACKLLFGTETFKVFEFYELWLEADRTIKNIHINKAMLGALIGQDNALLSQLNERFSISDFFAYAQENKDKITQALGERVANALLLMNFFSDVVADSLDKTIDDLLASLRSNFVGAKHSRIIMIMDMPNDDQDTFALIDTVKLKAVEYFGEENYVAGESMTVKDISEAFRSDLLKINLVTVISIFIIIAVLFRSVTLPAILVLVIQGAIWITMAIMAVFKIPIFFMSYIICICIQMGATIDYGILISSNFRHNRATMDKRKSVIEAVKSAMPTILTSGLILISAGFIIGFVSSVMPIYSIGRLLGMGTIISIALILLLLPALLYIFDKVISYTTWDGTRKLIRAAGPGGNGVTDGSNASVSGETEINLPHDGNTSVSGEAEINLPHDGNTSVSGETEINSPDGELSSDDQA